MERVFSTGTLVWQREAKLREILEFLRTTYCGSIGAEYMHVTEPAEKRWWQQKLESIRSKPTYSPEKKKAILERRVPG